MKLSESSLSLEIIILFIVNGKKWNFPVTIKWIFLPVMICFSFCCLLSLYFKSKYLKSKHHSNCFVSYTEHIYLVLQFYFIIMIYRYFYITLYSNKHLPIHNVLVPKTTVKVKLTIQIVINKPIPGIWWFKSPSSHGFPVEFGMSIVFPWSFLLKESVVMLCCNVISWESCINFHTTFTMPWQHGF